MVLSSAADHRSIMARVEPPHELLNPFDNDDLLQRSLILWLMGVLVAYGNNAPLDDEDIGAYMTARMTCNSAHLL